MRLVIATPLYPPESGGPGTYARLLEEGLSNEGVAVTSVLKFAEVRNHPPGIRHLVYAYRVYTALRSADMVLALDPVSVGFPTMLAAFFSRKPYVVKVVGDYAWEQGMQRFGVTDTLDEFVKRSFVPFPVWVLRIVQTLVVRFACAVIVPSGYLEKIVRSWRIPKTKQVQVIANAMNDERIGTVPQSVASLPVPLVVSAGRLVPWKNMPGVIDAIAEIRKDGIAASLAIVGDGPDRKQLEEYGKRVGAVFTGALPHADTLAVIDRADVFVLNSSYEGLSHLLIEAISLGVPTVATHVGGNASLVRHNVNGLLVPLGDTHELSKAIRHLFDREEAKRLTAESGRFREQFSKEAMFTKTAAFLKTLV